MTFLKEKERRRETLRTTKPNLRVMALVAAVVSVGGYVLLLAVLAPEQLAEATITASDVVCSQCVGTSDIADNAVTSGKIGGKQVKTSDIADNAINTAKILDGQVGGADIASQPFGVGTSDINNGAVNTVDIANDAIKPNVHIVKGDGTLIAPGGSGTDTADCPAGEILTGGGFSSTSRIVRVIHNFPFDENTWSVAEVNDGATPSTLFAFAICIGPSP
jgi:hypothetical protein